MTDIKEPINTTSDSDGTSLSVVYEKPQKVLLAKSWGGLWPPQPPRNYPPETVYRCRGKIEYAYTMLKSQICSVTTF